MPMARVSARGHKLLQEMAQHRGVTQQQVLDEALETLQRKRFFEEANRAYADLRQDPAASRALDEERHVLDGAVEDGIMVE